MMRHIFAISDLHLGGRPEREPGSYEARPTFQINHSVTALVEFIDWIRTSYAPNREAVLELVINGDIVDFLAEDDLGAALWTADEDEAVRKLELVFRRTREHGVRGVFDALADLLAAGHRLTLLLGNHDVELALPKVRERLCAELTRGELDRRLHFLYDGEAYTIGRLLIEHGNRYDRWNMIDHSRLRQERSMRSRRLPIDEALRKELYFMPPAGTHLVVRFMNRIKARYRFIDLLKPEEDAVFPLLVALEPDYWPLLDEILVAAPLGLAFRRHKLAGPATPRLPGDMGAGPNVVARPSVNTVLREVLGPEARRFAALAPIEGDMGLFNRAAKWVDGRADELAEQARSLSRLRRIKAADTDEARLAQLHAALRHLGKDDTTFHLEAELPQYVDGAVETTKHGAVDVVVYGHTHLPKVLDLSRLSLNDPPGGPHRGHYYNTGTWSDVMRLPGAIAEDGAASQKALVDFVQALRLNDFAPYVKRYLTYFEAHVDSGTGAVERHALHSYCGPGRERAPALTEDPSATGCAEA